MPLLWFRRNTGPLHSQMPLLTLKSSADTTALESTEETEGTNFKCEYLRFKVNKVIFNLMNYRHPKMFSDTDIHGAANHEQQMLLVALMVWLQLYPWIGPHPGKCCPVF